MVFANFVLRRPKNRSASKNAAAVNRLGRFNRRVAGWDGRTRTCEMTESKSVALPLGYIPI